MLFLFITASAGSQGLSATEQPPSRPFEFIQDSACDAPGGENDMAALKEIIEQINNGNESDAT